MKKLRTDRLMKLIIIFSMFVFAGSMGLKLISQQQQLAQLAAEKEMLEEQKKTIAVEIEQAKRMIEFSTSDAYIEQFARERFGWVKKGEIKFFEVNAQSQASNTAPTLTQDAIIAESESIEENTTSANDQIAITDPNTYNNKEEASEAELNRIQSFQLARQAQSNSAETINNDDLAEDGDSDGTIEMENE